MPRLFDAKGSLGVIPEMSFGVAWYVSKKIVSDNPDSDMSLAVALIGNRSSLPKIITVPVKAFHLGRLPSNIEVYRGNGQRHADL